MVSVTKNGHPCTQESSGQVHLAASCNVQCHTKADIYFLLDRTRRLPTFVSKVTLWINQVRCCTNASCALFHILTGYTTLIE